MVSRRPLPSQVYRVTYDGIVSDITTDPSFSDDGDVFGDGENLYADFGDTYYVVADWTIPNTQAYIDLFNNGYALNGQAPGSILRAGTVLNGAFFDANSSLPELATTLVTPGTPATPAQPGTSAIAAMLAPGSLSASISLVSGADLQAADVRSLKAASTLASYFKPAAYTGTISDITTSPLFSSASFGADQYRYDNNDNLYITSDWTVPNDLFYNVNNLRSESGTWYGPGQTIPAGTQLQAGFEAFEVGASTPSLATSIAPSEVGQGHMVLDGQQQFDATGGLIPNVIRTGTGDLDLYAGGSFSENTLYGVYTAGTQSANVTAAYETPSASSSSPSYQFYYPTNGGDLTPRRARQCVQLGCGTEPEPRYRCHLELAVEAGWQRSGAARRLVDQLRDI